MEKEEKYFVWWDDDEYAKMLGQFRMQLNEILFLLRKYGQDAYVEGAQHEIMQLVEIFGQKIRGVDKPLLLKERHNPRY